MCTLSWAARDDGYDVLFSRDERRTRLPASPPRAADRRGVRFVAPRDGDFGGSWIVANERGVTLCMLNLYAGAGPSDARFTSRGLLLLDAADAATARDAAQRIERADLPRYRPFSVVALGPVEAPRLVQWDGADVVAGDLRDADRPFVSSSYDLEGARRARRSEFARFATSGAPAEAAQLDAFHRSHAPSRGPYSVCMHRDDARTVSLVQVFARPDAVTMWYADGPPCTTPSGEPVRLPRRGAAA